MAPSGIPRILAVIPARHASTRFPGKVIASVAGKPLVAHTYARACESVLVSDVVVATDDQRVADALAPFGIPVVMTRADHPSGTDRIAEVAASRPDAEIIVNVQGDEPLLDPKAIDAAIEPLLDDPAIVLSTARRRLYDRNDINDPNVVKVVTDVHGRALYFSRCPIPAVRDEADLEHAIYWQHIGMYVYRREFLALYAGLEPTPLEKLERLEQLRVLENGYAIAVVDTDYRSIGVDTPGDLDRVRALFDEE